ncbi:acyltransferase family protein [Specibacter cremeus]|uniref:acyltransferase family protein n=1 Tax=Specibacter cremeus TaxID=1629051 RepID=UPI000F7905FD|nr:acyltransferase family protein [Specibacter cremeus]
MRDAPATVHAGTLPAAGEARLAQVDRIKIALTVGVICAHASITYGAIGSWFYHEPTAGQPLRAVLDIPLAFGELFGMGLFFFLAGAFTPASFARKGRTRFLRDRWLRLGVPFTVFVLVVVPLIQWSVSLLGPHGSLPAAWLAELGYLDSGPLWFVGVLLVYSTVYALLAGRRPVRRRFRLPAVLAVCAVGVATASFVLRLWFPVDSFQLFAAHVWQWGQCAGLFMLGLHAGRHGWFNDVPRALRRTCAGVLVAGLAGVVALLMLFSSDLTPLAGGWHWESLVVALLEGAVSVAAAVVVVSAVPGGPPSPVTRFAARAAYPAYIVQAPVLVGIALALRPLALSGGVKLAILAPTAVVGSFAVAAALLAIPVLRRIL